MTVLLNVVLWGCTGSGNCQINVIFAFETVFIFLTMSASSLLVVLRSIAIWNRDKVVMALAISVWGINAVLYVLFFVRLRIASAYKQLTCEISDLESFAPNPIAPNSTRHNSIRHNPISFNPSSHNPIAPNPIIMLITDITLLLIMLVGLFRLRRHGSGTLAQVLWKQGVIWLLLTIVALVPPTVFMILFWDASFDITFLLSACITMAIAATRMYRYLTDFARNSTDVPQGDLVQKISPPVQGNQLIHVGSIPVNRMEVVVHTVSQQHDETCRTRDDDSCIRADEEMHEIPNEWSRDHEDVERAW